MPVVSGICGYCNEPFERYSRSKPPRYCSSICQRRSENRRRGREWTNRDPRPCAECGDTFQPGHWNQRYCSPKCKAVRDRRDAPSHKWGGRCQVFYGECRACGSVTVGNRRTKAWCSAECKRGERVDTSCDSCGTPLTGRTDKRYCSAQCRTREARARRRARTRRDRWRTDRNQGRIRRIAIYERDDWTCQLCGSRVDRGVKVPHPQAPTLDHIVPVSQGGAHAESNLQLAHHGCNSKKRDGLGERGNQLRMAV